MKILDKLRNIQRDIALTTEREIEKVTSYHYDIACGDILKFVSLKSNCVEAYCIQFLTNHKTYMVEIPINMMKDLDIRKIAKKLLISITEGRYENVTVY